MLNKIIEYSLKNRLVILIASLLLILVGTDLTRKMEIDVFPELTAPTVVIMTEAHGMAPEAVERLVSFPIETAVNGATSIRRIRSASAMGFSLVWVEFEWGVDIFNARQTVTERLIQVSEELPLGVGRPVIAPQTSLLGEILIIGLESDKVSPMELRTIAEWNVRPRLLSIGGVAQVTTIGGDFKEYQVLLDPFKMRYYDVSMSEVMATCENMNDNSSGGFINEYGNEYIIRGLARTNKLDELGNSVIKIANGFPVKVKDIATLKTGSAPKIGTGSYNGKDAVLITINKQPGINTVALTKDIKEALKDIEKNLESTVQFHTDIYDQSDFIITSVNNVKKALFEGGIFVAIILFIFLMNYRTTVISLLAIPLSLLVSIIVLKAMGFTINTMSLGGMAIAIGSLVDDAIIDVENVYKHLRRNVQLPKAERANIIDIVYTASTEIRPSILNATLIIIITFIPLFLLDGMEGRMLRPLGVSFIVSLFASLVVAVTITPVLCTYFLTNEKRIQKRVNGSWIEQKLNKGYKSLLVHSLNKKSIIYIITSAVIVLAMVFLLGFGRNFLPPFNEGAMTINTSTLPGISLDESSKIGREAENILLTFPEIKSLARRTGRAEFAEHSFGVNVSEIDVPFELKDRSRAEFLQAVREELAVLPGTNVEVGQPITHRMDHMLSGTKANIAIKLFGDDLNIMFKIAQQIKVEIADIEGIGDLNVEQQIDIPQIKIKAKREMLAKYGIPVNNFVEFVEVALGGKKMSDVFEDEQKFDLILRYNNESRDNLSAIRNAMIDTYDGKKVPLSFIADIESSSGPNSINRENVQRKIVVSVNVSDRDVGSVVNDIQNRVDETVILPENYRLEYGGQFESADKATKTLLLASLVAILLVFMILYQEFKSTKLALIVLLNLPLSIIGGVFAIKMSSGVISIPSIIGFITLFGIATRNGILLISKYQHLKQDGLKLYDRIIQGSIDRLNPILMTALTAALALIPLAIQGDLPGNEIQSPMAIVILGGLLTSTLLNVFVIPSVYYLINRKEENES